MPRQALHAVAELYLGDALKPEPPPKPAALTAAEMDSFTGLYRNEVRGDTFRIVRDGGALHMGDGTPLIAVTPRRLTDGDELVIEVAPSGSGTMDDGSGSDIPIQRVRAARPTIDELARYAGDYASVEAGAGFAVRVQGDELVLTSRPDRSYPLTPIYADAFDSELGTILFRRGRDRVTEFSVVQDRVWDLRFRREMPGPATKRVLAFGDSNTWGWIPVERGYPTSRYSGGERWPGIAQASLGGGYEIVEEALNGRTSDLADPTVPELPGAGFDGSAYLPAAIASHLPLDLVVIMLGTNDLKTAFDRSPEEVAAGIRKLIDLAKAQDRAAWTEYPAPKVLVVAPPPMSETERFPAQAFARRSREVAAACRALRDGRARLRRRVSRRRPHHDGGRRGRAAPQRGGPSTSSGLRSPTRSARSSSSAAWHVILAYAWAGPEQPHRPCDRRRDDVARSAGAAHCRRPRDAGRARRDAARPPADCAALARDHARPRDPRHRRGRPRPVPRARARARAPVRAVGPVLPAGLCRLQPLAACLRPALLPRQLVRTPGL